MAIDLNVQMAKLQLEICDLLGLDKDNVLFNFGTENDETLLEVITINPVHNQSFLLHKEVGSDKVEVLTKIKEYTKRHNNSENSYTIQWIKVGESELHTSYFRAHNVYGVLEKFYHDSEVSEFKIFSITLNPIS